MDLYFCNKKKILKKKKKRKTSNLSIQGTCVCVCVCVCVCIDKITGVISLMSVNFQLCFT